jgi:hypothetical protein
MKYVWNYPLLYAFNIKRFLEEDPAAGLDGSDTHVSTKFDKHQSLVQKLWPRGVSSGTQSYNNERQENAKGETAMEKRKVDKPNEILNAKS